ncbi:MAG TPA: hypothetical protein VIM73_12120 [Polyangiaceae bacterium]
MRSARLYPILICGSVALGLAGCSSDDGGDAGSRAQGGRTGSGGAGSFSGESGSLGGSAPVVLDDGGAAELAGAQGITGTVDGKTYTLTASPLVSDYGESYKYLLIEAQGNAGTWTLGIPKKLGIHPCGKHTDIASGEIAYILGPADTGSAGPLPNSTCSVEVTHVEPMVEGRFAGTLVVAGAPPKALTAGYFFIERN